MSKTLDTTVELPTIQVLLARIVALEESVAQLSLAPNKNTQQREMTDADAHRILTGDLKDMKHNKAAETLGLSYGQIYSCRGEYTFRHIHKEMSTKGIKNPWKK